MKTLQFKIEKAGHTFTLTHKQNGFGSSSVEIEGPNLYITGDTEFDCPDEKKDKITGSIKDGQIKFHSGYFLHQGTKYGRFTIDASIYKQIEDSMNEDKENWHVEIKDREANRTSPYLDRTKFEVFDIGCDTGLIYHVNEKAIKLAIKNGAKQYDVLRGQRDALNKYPGQMDDFIPVEYAVLSEGKYKAEGYNYLYPQHYCIEKSAYEDALKQIEQEKERQKSEYDKALSDKFALAKTTGKPVVISKIVVQEEDSPLSGDDEGDLVDICQMAMPDGTIQEMYFHNY